MAGSIILERALGGVATLILAGIGIALAYGNYDIGIYLWVEVARRADGDRGNRPLSKRARPLLRRFVPILKKLWVERHGCAPCTRGCIRTGTTRSFSSSNDRRDALAPGRARVVSGLGRRRGQSASTSLIRPYFALGAASSSS